MRCVLVSHTHWDREWYKTFQAFRARLVDTVDRVLDLLAEDPGWSFQLDGQTIVLEDYLEIRPDRRQALVAACQSGRLGIGPWYVQPDSLIPAGETHVRNLLEGRRVAAGFGAPSRVAYTPDSFGHPAQLPQIFAGFGLGPFVYWRGHGNEVEGLPADWIWRAPDGSEIAACHLEKGYFNAWGLSEDLDQSVRRLSQLVGELAPRSRRERVLLLNGIDHQLPDANTRAVAEALAKATGFEVERGLLDAYTEGLGADDADTWVGAGWPRFEGELVGGRNAPLLPGVWSTHLDLKLANRRCESLLCGWLEPFCEIGRWLGGPDERASVRTAWRALIPNQAHDSICGCSQDRVHQHMATRYDEIEELAYETTARLLERIGGLDVERQVAPDPQTGEITLAVYNPTPRRRSDRVRLALDGFPAFSKRGIAPLLAANLGAEGFSVDGRPARLIADRGSVRPMLSAVAPAHDIEFVVDDVPALGFKRVKLARTPAQPDTVDDGRRIANDRVEVTANDDGTFDVRWGERRFRGLGALRDVGDRGDTYDFDRVGGGETIVERVTLARRRHASGLDALILDRTLRVPAGLADDRMRRSDEQLALRVRCEVSIVPGLERVDLRVCVDNTARDHRLQLRFPTGRAARDFRARTTFDVARRETAPPDDAKWVQRAPGTFAQQGFVESGGLQVSAPGLVEAAVSAAGDIDFTLVRSVGWLSRGDLATRPMEAGPNLPTPGAQCLGRLEARLSLSPGFDPAEAQAAELGLRAVASSATPSGHDGACLLRVDPPTVELSAFKPAEDGDGSILRLLHTGDAPVVCTVRFGAPLAERIGSAQEVRLDESPLGAPTPLAGDALVVTLRPHGLLSMRLRAP